MKSAFLRNALVLGMLSAVGPFAIDMYLPSFPAIAREFQVDVSAVQMSLMSFFLAVSVCQIVYGPLSDRFGRKPPLYFGLGLFVLAGIGCSFAPNVETLIAFRFLQGVGSCAAMVIPRAIIRDLHTGHEAARLMATTMLVFSVSPILAPLAGSTLTAFFSWRVIFWAIAAIGLAGLAVVVFLLPETHKPGEERRGLGQAFATYGRLLKDRRFLGLAFIGGFSQASFFAYLAGSSVIFIEHFGLSPSAYSMIFASNAIAFIGSAQFNSIFMRRFGAERVVRTAISAFAMLVSLLFVLTILGVDNAFVLWGLLFLSFGCLGYVIPSTAVLALEEHGPIAGTASALMGTLQLGTGAAIIVLVSLSYNGTSVSMVSAIFVCALVALTLSFRIMKPKRDYP
jgi:MFS transporter, DHA1 family, multidrug resistance protein